MMLCFYHCSFTVPDEIDGEKSTRSEMVSEYAEKLQFINTDFCEPQRARLENK